MSEKIVFPEWREGTWWVTSVRQRATWLRNSQNSWLDPFLWKFEVVSDDQRYLLKVTYPEKVNSLTEQHEKFFDVFLSKDDFKFIEGTLYIGHNKIPMYYDFLATILRNHPPGVDQTGSLGREKLLKGRLDQIFPEKSLETYTLRTPTGGIVVSSTELPYHLRIREANYSIELEAWFIQE